MPRTDQPRFVDVQRAFAAHIRNPELNPPPADVEPRRMRVYVDLFHRNIQTFLTNGFPTAKAVLGTARWNDLVRGFIHRHGSETPYFLDIGQEFMTFLAHAAQQPAGADVARALDLPDWFLELCHYEWVKRSLRTAVPDIPAEGIDPDGDLLARPVVVSPLIRPLCYGYRVHEIVGERAAQEPAAGPAWLIACRRRDDTVTVIKSNALTHRLVDILAPEITGNEALATLSAENPGIDKGRLHREGAPTLERLRDAEVLLGVRC